MNAPVALYSAVDDELTHYEVDVEAATLTQRATVKVPAKVQYAWPHPSRRTLYVSTSNRGKGLKADLNHNSAFRIDPASGALASHGEPATLPHRAVHICVTPDGQHVLSAHNLPRAGITIHRINADGTLGAVVAQPDGLPFGIYPHQVMTTPSNRTVILVDRGNAAEHGKPEDPGALRLFSLKDGGLSPLDVIAPNGGRGFGVRHLDFHPTQPWVYVSLEIQSELHVYRMAGDSLEPQATFVRDLLANRANIQPRQLGGTVQLHPNGRYVYLINRADHTVEHDGKKVFGGGENSIAVFAIDQNTGEPTLIQHADTHSYHVRTFAIDPSGRLLVSGSIKPLAVRDGDTVTTVPAALSVFRIRDDGKLDFMRKYDVDATGKTHYWMGMIGL
jgi:6-phosphogluconolactonase (cycloisomerase 2 family)